MLEKAPEIRAFEDFLKTIGFKRSDGAIFGLLTLSEIPLSSEEIVRALKLSQGAVSQGLKNLSHWGAIRSEYSPSRRAHLHTATEDSLSIVATLFQKRELGAIEAFQRANEAAKQRFLLEGAHPKSPRIQRLESYITTCRFAQVIIDFTLHLSRTLLGQNQYSKIIATLPKVLSPLTFTIGKVARRSSFLAPEIRIFS